MAADLEDIKARRYVAIAPRLINNLRRRHFRACFVETREEAAEKVLDLIPPKSSVSWGGSVTLEQAGILEKIKSGPYKVLDRADAESREEKADIMRRALSVDYYLTSFNAVSMDGVVLNVDATGNRVAAITYGPANVIAVVGMNKIREDSQGAIDRAFFEAAQLNAARFGKEEGLYTDEDITDDIQADGSICNVVSEILTCKPEGRIHVILVGEDLGFRSGPPRRRHNDGGVFWFFTVLTSFLLYLLTDLETDIVWILVADGACCMNLAKECAPVLIFSPGAFSVPITTASWSKTLSRKESTSSPLVAVTTFPRSQRTCPSVPPVILRQCLWAEYMALRLAERVIPPHITS